MAEPATGLTLAWLLDHAWTGLLLVFGMIWRQQRKDKEDTDAKYDEHGRMFHEAHSRIAVIERRQDDFEKRQIEDRDDHRVALEKFDRRLGELHQELHLLRTDMGTALTDFRKETASFLAEVFRKDRP